MRKIGDKITGASAVAIVAVALRVLSLPLLPLLDSGQVPLTDVDYSVFQQSFRHAGMPGGSV
jgi:hypothetical protein